jgi:disintegrin and metalloproteinase domain-containing protein 10
VSPHTGAYYVEKAHRYFPNVTITDPPEVTFHSVIYHDRDVNDPYHHRRTGEWPRK